MNKEKTNFILGLTTGLAIVAVIGLIIMSVAYVKKDGSGSADKGGTGQVAEDNVVNNNRPTAPTPTPTPSKVSIKAKDDDHIRGNKNAKVTIIEYSDFQCPYCSRFHTTLEQALEKYPNDVRWIYRHFPLDSIHPYARKAAEASECAGDQNKFWEYADGLYENQKSINPAYLSTLAKELKLNTSSFETCLSSGKYANKVSTDLKEGQSYGITGTPGGFLNGQKLRGAIPFTQLEQMILSEK